MKVIKKCDNPVDVCFAVYDCFCKYSFASPDVYELLFFANRDNKFEEYTKQYYELFPEKTDDEHEMIQEMFRVNNIYSRSSIMLHDCVEQGYLSRESADDLNDISLMLYKNYLHDVKDGLISPKEARTKFMRYYRRLMGFYAKA
jgi:hypothetical protein